MFKFMRAPRLSAFAGAVLVSLPAAAELPPTQADPMPSAAAAPQPSAATAADSHDGEDKASSGLPRVGLRQALHEALSRQLQIRIAHAEVTRAQSLIGISRAGFLPTLIGHGSYLRLDHERSTVAGLVASRDQLAADLTLTVPLFAPRAWNETSQASENAKSAELDFADTRRQVALATAQSYLAVMAQHRNIEVNERALANANAHYQYAHARFEGGVGNQVDDVRAGQEVATSTSQLEQARAGLYAAHEALGIALGRDRPVDVIDQLDLPTPPDLTQGLQDATRLRSDVQADTAALTSQKHVLENNWAEYAPLLAAQAQPFYHQPGTVALPHTGWQVGLLLTIPFYDGGARESVIKQREVTYEQRRVQLEWSLRQAKSEVRVAFNGLQHADATLGSAKQAAELAGQALRFANLSYEAGASTNIEVVDAERRARDADTAVVIAEDASRQARLGLLAASGHFP